MNPPYRAVEQQLQVYFDGLYYSDTQRLRQVFHPQAIYACVINGQLRHYTMEQYFPIVDQRLSPASQAQTRQDRIMSIELIGATTALARVECAIAPKQFSDTLSLVWLDGRWQIIAKVFEVILIPKG
ncbi:MAG: nuclear transport factor 2 family protein [Pseudomonadota bacterium]|nr:nuclear transport factor 2 family protein [Pseudomonadota bacterium]